MLLGESIQKILEEKAMSIYRLSKESKVPYATLSEIARGLKPTPRVNTVKNIAKGLGVTMDELLKGVYESE